MGLNTIEVAGNPPDYGYGRNRAPTTAERAEIIVEVVELRELTHGMRESFLEFMTEMNGYLALIPEENRASSTLEFTQGDHDYERSSISVSYRRLETDAEYEMRLAVIDQHYENIKGAMAARSARIRAEDLRELARLKDLYEPTPQTPSGA